MIPRPMVAIKLWSIGAFLACILANSAYAVGPIIQYVQVSTSSTPSTQTGTFNMSNGIVSNSFSLPYLTAGLCTTTNSAGQVVNTNCGSGGGGGGSGTVSLGNQYQVPFYSSSGSSNTLAGSGDLSVQSSVGVTISTFTASSGTVTGQLVIGKPSFQPNPITFQSGIIENANNSIQFNNPFNSIANDPNDWISVGGIYFDNGTNFGWSSVPHWGSGVVTPNAPYLLAKPVGFNRAFSTTMSLILPSSATVDGAGSTGLITTGTFVNVGSVVASTVALQFYDLLNATQTWTGGNSYSSVTVQNITINGTCTGAGCGSGGGSSTLAVEVNGVRVSSPTPDLNAVAGAGIKLQGTTNGTTTQILVYLDPNATNYIQNTSTLQSGATFFVSSGTVNNTFTANTGQFYQTNANLYTLNNGTGAVQAITGLDNQADIGIYNPVGNVILRTSNKNGGLNTGGLEIYASTVQFHGNFVFSTTASTWTWPAADGTNNQCLATNGSGKLSFSTISGGGSSSLAVTTGTTAGYISIASSPTAILMLDENHFSSILTGNATNFISLLSSQTFMMVTASTMTTSSFTVTGQGNSELDGSKNGTAYNVIWSSTALTAGNCTVATGTDTVAGIACGSGGGGSGTVNSGLAGQIAYYAANGTTVGGATNITVDGSSMTVSTMVVTSDFTCGSTSTACHLNIFDSTFTLSGYQVFIGTGPTPAVLDVYTSTNGLNMIHVSTAGQVNFGTNSTIPSSFYNVVSPVSNTYEATFSTGTGTFHVAVSTAGHFVTFGMSPSVVSCGSSPGIVGDDNQGTITIGSGSTTACTLNFAQTWGTTPICTITDNSVTVAGDISSISATSVTFGFSASLGGGTVWYKCGCSGKACR